MPGYWRKPDKTSEVLFRDGAGKLWFRSGDVGRMDHDGYVYILDRYASLCGLLRLRVLVLVDSQIVVACDWTRTRVADGTDHTIFISGSLSTACGTDRGIPFCVRFPGKRTS